MATSVHRDVYYHQRYNKFYNLLSSIAPLDTFFVDSAKEMSLDNLTTISANNVFSTFFKMTFFFDTTTGLYKLRKNLHSALNIKPNPKLPNKPWRDTFSGVRRALRFLSSPDDIVSFYVKRAQISPIVNKLLDVPVYLLIPFLSNIKTIFHNNCDFLSKEWYCYLDIQNIAGYPAMIDRDMSDDPQLWLSTPSVSYYDADWWSKQFRKTYFSQTFNPNPSILSYKDFVLHRWLWVTDGATRFSAAKLDGEVVKTKFGAALSLSDDELLKHAYLQHPTSFIIGVFLKPDEPGYKRRLIANVSLGPYLVAAYMRYFFEQNIGTNPSFMHLKVSVGDRVNIVQMIREGVTMVPLDESSYDYNVSKESWDGFISFLTELDPNNDAFKLFSYYKSNAKWSFDGREGNWLAGMPSGLALTSYLNSWMNYIKQSQIIPGMLAFAAGDDVLTALRNMGVDLEAVSREYAKFGSSINATKNWVAQAYAEYLKVLLHSKGTTGYPARIYSSLIWAGKVRTFLPSDRLPELSELFKQFFDRLGQPFDVDLVSTDLASAISHKVKGFNRSMARDWLHSPRAYGGFGLFPYVYKTWDWETTVLKKKKYENIIIRVPDINFYAQEVELVARTRRLHVNRRFVTGEPLRLRTPTSLEEWEARLNREDIPVKGKYASMALDVIPLPTIDRVSTSVVALFAQSWGYHVYPNIKGATDTIVDALILASIDLRARIVRYMEANHISELAA